jgi:cellobiose phosphorylase
MKQQILHFIEEYKRIKNAPDVEALEGVGKLPGAYFLGEDILVEAGSSADCRYPYGEDGFNYWTYGTGYIHCNEGLFSPFLRATEGAEPKIGFFAGVKGENHKFSCLSVPEVAQEPEELERFTIFTKEATYYITETAKLITGIRTFVKGHNIYFGLFLHNKTDKPIEVFTSSYFNPFLKNALVENSTDRWFRQVKFEEDTQTGRYLIETYEEKDRGIMATNYGLVKTSVSDLGKVLTAEHTTSRLEFVGGITSSLHRASALQQEALSDTKHSTCFTETGICGDMITYNLDTDVEYVVEISYAKDEEGFNQIYGQEFTAEVVEEAFNGMSKESKESLAFKFENVASDDVQVKDSVLNPFMTYLQRQVAFCSEIKGFVQLSHFSLIGIRDIFQALEAYLFFEPEKAREKMLEALNFTSPDGRLPRQYSLPKREGARPAMDLRPFIDQGVWVISTIMTYLRQTKDFSILSEVCGYYDFIDDHKHIAQKSEQQDTVLEHLIVIMDFLLKNRDHQKTKCVLALYGDWNDALDGLGKSNNPDKEYGTGVSVMATLQVYQNLAEMIELLDYIKEDHTLVQLNEGTGLTSQFEALVADYQKAQEEIHEGLQAYAIDEDRIVHGWGDELSYYVGSRKDPDGVARDGLTSNAFWILSGLMKEDTSFDSHRDMILKAYKRLDSTYGMKTFEPYFEKGTHGVGRIPNLPKGTAENGATYIHASMFGVMSLFAIGESEKAWNELFKLLPVTHSKVSVSPFVLPNSYGLNEEFGIDGESMQDWQTGSSNVLLKTIIRFVVGFEPTLNGLYIQPSQYQPYSKSKMTIQYQNKQLVYHYQKRDHSSEEAKSSREFYLNGVRQEATYDEYMKTERLFISDETIEKIGERVEITVMD